MQDGGVEEVSKILLNANHHAYRAKLLVKVYKLSPLNVIIFTIFSLQTT
jgi:hypothetical protein